jgi:hypothetical protein
MRTDRHQSIHMRLIVTSLWLSFGALLSAGPAVADTYVVNPGGTGDYITIQAAVDDVAPGSIIELTDGTFLGDGNRDIDFHGKAVTVVSQYGPTNCIINPEGQNDIGPLHGGFIFQSGEGQGSVVDGITISGGVTRSGGGIFIQEASPWIKNCVITGNVAGGVEHSTYQGRGGGVYCGLMSSARFTNCRFSDNYTTSEFPSLPSFGGGAYCTSSTPTFENCVFSHNVAWDGGGIYCSNAAATITDCVITGSFLHAPDSHGGGLYCVGTPPTVSGSTFCGNGAQYGGAIWLSSSSPAITNCTLYGNGSDAGDIGCELSSPAISKTIITAEMFTQAVYCDDASSSPALSCCDLYANPGGDWIGCIAGQLGSNGNISADPAFCSPTCGPLSADYTINSNSPCAPTANPSCGLIGAWPVACGAVPVLQTTWGAIKARFE